MGEVGFAEGLSRMFVRGLNELDVTKRPIHCTDVKRGYNSYKKRRKMGKRNLRPKAYKESNKANRKQERDAFI